MTDPFDLDIKKFLKTLKRYHKKWKSLDNLFLDAEILTAKVIELRWKWIKECSSSFYIDPALFELKLRMLEPHQLAMTFVRSWHPILLMEE